MIKNTNPSFIQMLNKMLYLIIFMIIDIQIYRVQQIAAIDLYNNKKYRYINIKDYNKLIPTYIKHFFIYMIYIINNFLNFFVCPNMYNYRYFINFFRAFRNILNL